MSSSGRAMKVGLLATAMSLVPIALGDAYKVLEVPMDVVVWSGLQDQAVRDQLLMVGVGYALAHPHRDFGGVIYLSKDLEGRSIESVVEQNRAFCAKDVPPFIAIDQEGGLVDRLSVIEGMDRWYDPAVLSFIEKYGGGMDGRLPSQEAVLSAYLSAADRQSFLDDYASYAGGLARTLRSLGFTMNLGPVLDVDDDIDGQGALAREDRTYGGPDHASVLAGAYLEGFSSVDGIVAVGKHFPGLGSVSTDTHVSGSVVSKSVQDLRGCDLVPYISCKGSLSAIMFSHATYGAIDPQAPASASGLVRSFARDSLGFDGLIISDDAGMGAMESYAKVHGRSGLFLACDMVLATDGEDADALSATLGSFPSTFVRERAAAILGQKLSYGLYDRR